MSVAFRILSLAVVCSVIAVLVRERGGVMAVLLSLAACSVILLAAVHFLDPALEFADKLRRLSGLDDSVTGPLLKVTGLGIVSQVAGSLCEDAGETALAKTVNICGAIFSIYASLPLLSAVVDMLERLMGG